MPCFIKESLCYKIYIVFFKTIKNLYAQSILKKVVTALAEISGQSKTFIIFDKYLKKKPYFLNSFFCRAVKSAANLIDKLLGAVYKLFLPIVSESFAVNEAKKILNFPIHEKLRLAAVFIASVDFGFCLGGFINGSLSDVNSVYIFMPVLICIFMIALKRIINIFQKSFIYKCIKFLLD